MQQAVTEKEHKAMRSVIMLVCWEIWKGRNAYTFRGKIVSTDDVLRSITQNLELWHLVGAKGLEHPLGAPDGRD